MKPFNDKININMVNFYKSKMRTNCQYLLCKTFGESFNKYTLLHIVKKIFAEPTRRFPHSSVSLSAPVTCNRVEQTLSTQLYSARLTRQEKRKDSKDYARLSGLWVYCIYKKHY
jgi:hypothetical protein